MLRPLAVGASLAGLTVLLGASHQAAAVATAVATTAALRRDLLTDPHRSAAAFCARPPENRACATSLSWRRGTWRNVCAEAPPAAHDLRFRPERYYRLELSCRIGPWRLPPLIVQVRR